MVLTVLYVPESGRDCLICAIFDRQRTDGGVGVVPHQDIPHAKDGKVEGGDPHGLHNLNPQESSKTLGTNNESVGEATKRSTVRWVVKSSTLHPEP